jgi:peptidoglycan-associated lipoprotein
MTRRTLFLSLVATTVTLGACRGKPEPAPAPAPVAAPVQPAGPTAAELAAEAARRRADSIAAANRATAAANAAAAAEAERLATSLKQTLGQPVYFDYDKDQIRDDAKAVLDAKAAILSANPTVTFLIVGHTDEQGTAEYNLALGQRRAAQVKRYLAAKGIDEARFTTQSMGDTQPAAKGTDEASYQLNRRDEFQSSNLPGVMTRPRG